MPAAETSTTNAVLMFARRTFVFAAAVLATSLCACHREGTTVPAGEQIAPGFTATDAGGQEVTLDGLLAGGPAVLVFYRGFW